MPVGFGHYRKYTIDTAVFDRMEPAAAWVLGLWLGNGCVTSNGYRASLSFGEDRDVGQKVSRIVGYSGPQVLSSCSKRCWVLEIGSAEFVAALKRVGVEERKAKTLSLPTVDLVLLPHLVRGLLDADGCWMWHARKDRPGRQLKCTFVSASRKAVVQVSAIASAVTGLPPHVGERLSGHGSVVYTFTVYSRAAREFGKYLYADSTEATRGARKHAIWEAGCVPCP